MMAGVFLAGNPGYLVQLEGQAPACPRMAWWSRDDEPWVRGTKLPSGYGGAAVFHVAVGEFVLDAMNGG